MYFWQCHEINPIFSVFPAEHIIGNQLILKIAVLWIRRHKGAGSFSTTWAAAFIDQAKKKRLKNEKLILKVVLFLTFFLKEYLFVLKDNIYVGDFVFLKIIKLFWNVQITAVSCMFSLSL